MRYFLTVDGFLEAMTIISFEFRRKDLLTHHEELCTPRPVTRRHPSKNTNGTSGEKTDIQVRNAATQLNRMAVHVEGMELV